MKKYYLFAALIVLLGASPGYATTYADADYFGSIDPMTGNPTGIHLVAVPGMDRVTTDFDFVNADSTASFNIGAPYDLGQQGTYSSQLGYVIGTGIDPTSLFFTFFLRDPNGGGEHERIIFGPGDLVFRNGGFTGSAALDFGGNLALIGDIMADGSVFYRVRATGGEFILDGAFARFNVPEAGSTVALLGVALGGLSLLRRRLIH